MTFSTLSDKLSPQKSQMAYQIIETQLPYLFPSQLRALHELTMDLFIDKLLKDKNYV